MLLWKCSTTARAIDKPSEVDVPLPDVTAKQRTHIIGTAEYTSLGHHDCSVQSKVELIHTAFRCVKYVATFAQQV